jgi:hypothetical protein
MNVCEFFDDCVKDFKVPTDWVDIRYHNDTCPSFYYKGYQIFVDHAEPKQRECDSGFRFLVGLDLDYGSGGEGWNFQSDSIDEVLKEVSVDYLTRPLLHDRQYYIDETNRIKWVHTGGRP